MKNKTFRILLFLGIGLISNYTFSQVQSNNIVEPNITPGQNPFFDASAKFDITGDATSNGKGFVFPRTDLTDWTFTMDLMNGVTYPSGLDGMIVYNIGEGWSKVDDGTGNNPTVSTKVSHGYYYFSNPGTRNYMENTTVINGQWIRLTDSDKLTIPQGAVNPDPLESLAGDLFYNTTTKSVYYFRDTEWVTVSTIPKGDIDPVVTADTKVGETYYQTNADPTLNVLKIFNGTDWVPAGGVTSVLTDGTTITGDGKNTAISLNKSAIPISGFANATDNVSMGNGTTNYQINNLADPSLDQDAATKKYVDDFISNNGISFNTDRPLTVAVTGANGLNLGSGKTMSEFFEAFFFPAVAATPPTTSLSTTPTSFPYSTWKNWGSYASVLSFDWTVTNNSIADNTDDKNITSIKLKTGATELASAIPTGGDQIGTFNGIPIQNTNGNVTTDFTKTYTLEVIDEQPNTVIKNVTVTLNKAIQLTYGNPTLNPATTVYEYDGADKNLTLNWSITVGDETITDIAVSGTSTGSTSATGSTTVTFKTIENGGTVSQFFPLVVTGNLYGAGIAKNSPTVKWANRLYRGTITSATEPCDGSFTFSDAQVKALSSTQLDGTWKTAAGYDFVCDATGQYVVFAYPDDLTTPTVQYWDANFNVWQTYQAGDLKIIDRPNFVNQFNYSGTNYKLVFVCVKYTSATVKIRLQ